MKNINTKKSLWASGLSIFLCLALLIGTTLAWFTDSISNTGNKIQSGTLDIELNDGSEAPLFHSENFLWEPGRSQKATAGISNVGNLWIKYTMAFSNVQVTTPAGKSDITKVLDVYKVPANDATEADLIKANRLGTMEELMQPGKTITTDGILAPKGSTGAVGDVTYDDGDVFTIVIKMNEHAGNEYQGSSVSFTLKVLATQYTYEQDGFGNNQYDSDAQYAWTGETDTTWYEEAGADAPSYSLNTPEEFSGFVKLINDGTSFSNKTIQINEDFDFGMKEIPTMKSDNQLQNFTLEGNGHTLSNMMFVGHTVSNKQGQRYGNGLFGQIGGYDTVTISNLTIRNSDACADREDTNLTGATGILFGYVYGNATFNNVNVIDCTVTATQKSGGFIGYGVNDNGRNKIVFNNCKVSGMHFNSDYQSANFIGYIGGYNPTTGAYNRINVEYNNVVTERGTCTPLDDGNVDKGVVLVADDGSLYTYSSVDNMVFMVASLYDTISYSDSYDSVVIDGKAYVAFDTSSEKIK